MRSQTATASPTQSPAPETRKTTGRTHDPEGVKRDILAIAREEFVEHGFSGARVDEIAARTATSKRMIYYYFRDKEGLYIAVLEAAYAAIRNIEIALNLDVLPADEAMAKLVGFTFDYHTANPWFVRLVMIENIHRGRHLKQSAAIKSLNLSILGTVQKIYTRGVETGCFRAGIDVLDIHLTMTAPSFYNVSNRASLNVVFGIDIGLPAALAKRREIVIEMMLRFLKP